MKKCPSCGATFDDAMRFCQVDGTPLEESQETAVGSQEPEAAFDPYATIVGGKLGGSEPVPSGEEVLEPLTAPAAAAEPDNASDVLDLGGGDPLKTMYVSDAEMREVLGTSSGAETPSEEMRADTADTSTAIPPPPAPSFLDPPQASEAETMYQSQAAPPPSPFDPPGTPLESYEPQPMQQQEWTPPPAPTPEWQNQQIGSNTPFQPPPSGAVGGQNKTLAIVSLVLGIISVCCYLAPVTGAAALVTGYMANKKISEDPNTYGGKGLATAGMITGGIFFALGIIYWIYIIFVIGLTAMSGGFR
jgi:hypothetical protein